MDRYADHDPATAGLSKSRTDDSEEVSLIQQLASPKDAAGVSGGQKDVALEGVDLHDLVSENPDPTPTGTPGIPIKDMISAAQQLSATFRGREKENQEIPRRGHRDQ